LPRFRPRDKAAFFVTAEEEVAKMLTQAELLCFPAQRGVALDFGCGLGRVTRALAGRFASCVGVDIASSMIEQAQALNADLRQLRICVEHGVKSGAVSRCEIRLGLHHTCASTCAGSRLDKSVYRRIRARP
jgi:SAM-dependent methyltransferase